MARKKKDEANVEQAQVAGEAVTVAILGNVHSITLSHRTIHCPNGYAYVTPEELERLKQMGLVAE